MFQIIPIDRYYEKKYGIIKKVKGIQKNKEERNKERKKKLSKVIP